MVRPFARPVEMEQMCATTVEKLMAKNAKVLRGRRGARRSLTNLRTRVGELIKVVLHRIHRRTEYLEEYVMPTLKLWAMVLDELPVDNRAH
jgi:hypothetical protein